MTQPSGPGWFPDPEGGPRLRWWDGRQWTSATSMPGAQPTPETPSQPGASEQTNPGNKKRNGLIAVGAVLALLIVYVGVSYFRSGASDRTDTVAAHATTSVAAPTTSAATSTKAAASTTTTTTRSQPPATTQAATAPDMSKCSDHNGEADPAMREAFNTLPLDPNIRLVSTQSVTHSDDRSMVAAIFYLCAPNLKGNQLKDYATLIARALKPYAFAETVKSMSVYNFHGQDTIGRVRCKEFQLHTFSETADSGAVRASWEDLP
ncbi:DUF2510 domain-containing protein [Rhodococcus sp. NPDC056960]|uniref:DUF2510 domain-containing protein n=1 Tax=Rhodococcus sp. NPDC056960 TaxID=3345982 RepID=UPI00363E2C7F